MFLALRVRCFLNVAELATDILFGKSEWMDTGAAGVQSVIAVKLYRSDIVKCNG